MGLEWDGQKAASNLRSHGVDFADAATVLSDDMAITIMDDSEEHEERHVTLGMDALDDASSSSTHGGVRKLG